MSLKIQTLDQARNLAAWSMAGVLALVAATPARAQPPAQFIIGVVASETDDKDAIARARKYFADAKTEGSAVAKEEKQRLDEGRVPGFPNAEFGPAVTPLELAAAASLPQFGIGDAVVAATLLGQSPKLVQTKEKPLNSRYRWARLGERELRVLKLDDKGKGDNSPAWKAAAQAREAKDLFIENRFKWPIYSRELTNPARTAFYALVREPSAELAVTERQLSEVRANHNAPPSVNLFFTDEGKQRLEQFTAELLSKPSLLFIALVRGGGIIEILSLKEKLDSGRMQLLGRYRDSEVDQIARDIGDLIPKQSNP